MLEIEERNAYGRDGCNQSAIKHVRRMKTKRSERYLYTQSHALRSCLIIAGFFFFLLVLVYK